MTLAYAHPDAEPVPVLRGLDPAAVQALHAVPLIYLLHLDVPFVVNGYAWRHYYGSTAAGRLAERMIEHRLGRSKVKFLELAAAQGCTWHLARVWPVVPPRKRYDEEQRIKAMGGASRSCPSCGIIPRFVSPDGRHIKILTREAA